MNRHFFTRIIPALCIAILFVGSENGYARSNFYESLCIGVKGTIGPQYNKVRMNITNDVGLSSRGEIALDISLFAHVPLRTYVADPITLRFNFPVAHTLFYATMFDVFQFEPTVTVGFPLDRGRGALGPIISLKAISLGVSLYRGPDYHSHYWPSARSEDFWAAGPIIGLSYGAVVNEYTNGREALFSIYFTPLFGVHDNRRGLIFGVFFERSFIFVLPKIQCASGLFEKYKCEHRFGVGNDYCECSCAYCKRKQHRKR